MADTVIPTIMDIASDHGWPGGEMPETVIEALGVLAGYIGGGDIDPEVIEQAVSDWLDDHPEATTTVEDGSITAAKFAPGVFVVLDDDDIDELFDDE